MNLIPFPRLHFFMLGFSPLTSHGSLFPMGSLRLDPTATLFLMRLVACYIIIGDWVGHFRELNSISALIIVM